jgi:uncharacterized cupin superfamily protein
VAVALPVPRPGHLVMFCRRYIMHGKVANTCARAVRFLAPFLFATSLCVAQGAAPGVLHPTKLSGGDPKALTGADVKTDVSDGNVHKNRVLGLSADGRFNSGMYSSQAEKGSIDSYPVDEFMYFLKGGVTLTSTDGSVVRVSSGEAVHIPRGWRGTWETAGYTKFYVVYDPDKAH